MVTSPAHMHATCNLTLYIFRGGAKRVSTIDLPHVTDMQHAPQPPHAWPIAKDTWLACQHVDHGHHPLYLSSTLSVTGSQNTAE